MLMQAATNNAKDIVPSGSRAMGRSFCWRQATKDKTRHKVERYLVQFFGDHPIEEITHFEIQLHLNRLAKDFADSTVRHAFSNIKATFRTGRKTKFIVERPCRRSPND